MIPTIITHRHAETAWPDLKERPTDPLPPPPGHFVCMEGSAAPTIEVALLRYGTMSGKGAAIIRLDWPNGATVIFQTSVAALHAAARSLMVMDGQL